MKKKSNTGLKKKKIAKKSKIAIHTTPEKMRHLLDKINHLSTVLIFVLLASIFVIVFSIRWYQSAKFLKLVPNDANFFISLDYRKDIKLPKSHVNYLSEYLYPEILESKIDAQLTIFQTIAKNNFLIIEKISEKDLLAWLKSINLNQEASVNDKIISITNAKPFFCERMKSAYICSESEKKLIEYQKEAKKIDTKIENSFALLPKRSDLYFYFDKNSFSSPLLKMHSKHIDSVLGKLDYLENDVSLQTLVITDRNYVAYNQESWFKKNLSEYVNSDNTIFYLEGNDLAQQWQNQNNYYSSVAPEYNSIIKGIIRKKTQDTFGNGIDFFEDILSILHSNYAFFVNKREDNVHFNLIANTKEFPKIDSLLESYYQNRAKYTIDKKALELSKDLVIESIYSNEDKISKADSRIGSGKIEGYQIQDSPYGFFVAKQGSKAYISSSLDNIEDMLNNPENNLSKNFDVDQAYEKGLLNLEKLSDIFSIIPFEQPLIPLLEGKLQISWETKVYDGGIMIWSKLK